MEFRIRKMKDTDAVAVCELSRQLGYPLDIGQFLGRLLNLSEAGNHFLWVMETTDGNCEGKVGDQADCKIVGWTHFERTLGLVHVPHLEVKALVVDEIFRGQGLGKRFMLFAESFARTEELGEVLVRSNVKREETHRFYEKLGYQKVKTSGVFLKAV